MAAHANKASLAGRVLREEWRSAAATCALLLHGELAQGDGWLGARLPFADGTTSVVFRETTARGGTAERPTLLVVAFRLRLIGRRSWPHAAFRTGSIVNTVLFAGFPGFRSKLWLWDPQTGVYRGIYEWDGLEQAVGYAETLMRVLRLIGVRGTVRYRVVAAVHRDDFLRDPSPVIARADPGGADVWWQVVAPVSREPRAMGDRSP